MKTKHCVGEDDPITGFCKATSECRESALFFLEGFGWDLDNAVSGFIQGHLPPLDNPLHRPRSRSRSPSRRRYSTTSALKSKYSKMDTDDIFKTWVLDTSLDDCAEPIRYPKDATHHEKMVTVPHPVNHAEGSVRAANESTSIEVGSPLSNHDSGSTR